MNRILVMIGLVLSCSILFGGGPAYAQEEASGATLVASGLEGGSGSTVGPDGYLYVADNSAGLIVRVDPETGEVETFAEGLPPKVAGTGGVMDVAFIDDTAYALVSLVGEEVGGSDIVGIYRVDGPDSFTVVADIGEFSSQNVPTNTAVSVPSGLQYAMEPYSDGFLVTDGHHNRVLQVGLDGEVTEVIAFGNTVPTGIALAGDTVYIAQAGPHPHMPADGKVESFEVGAEPVTEIASGASLVIDVEYGPEGRLFALSQGDWDGEPGPTPAEPNTGTLLEVNEDGTFTAIEEGLNQPTSLEFIDGTAYVVTLGGEIWKVEVDGEVDGACTLGSIEGAYVFQGSGVTVADDAVLPISEAGMVTFDGAGSSSGVNSVSVNGERVVSKEAFTGTYAVTSDCIYTLTIGEEGEDDAYEIDLYVAPSGGVMTYSSPWASGVLYR